MDKLNLYYPRDIFKDMASARSHFEASWPDQNPLIKRRMDVSGRRVEDEYEVARYKDGRWDFFSELIDYRERAVTPQYRGAREVIAQCPKCGKNGLVKSMFALQAVYVHVDAKEQNKMEALKVCAIQRRPGGLINTGDI